MDPSCLQYQLHISEPVPFTTGEVAPNGDPRMYQPIASTLVHGTTDAVLVDPPMTVTQAHQVADWIESSGKTLRYMYLTHGHGDHWFGAGPLLERFPGVPVLASAGTIEVMRFHASPEGRAIWESQFADLPAAEQIRQIFATTPKGGQFELENHRLRIVDVGHSDTDSTTVLHVPSIDLVVAGDVVYNGVHQYLVEAANGGLRAWMSALDKVAALRPRHVVASHKNPALPDLPETIAATRGYLAGVETLSTQTGSALEFFEAMLKLHPDRLNPSALWFWGALAMFPAAG
jgi:glyoxylase-like metal-dependent hydrolase (beta-lactamase superfamily II)